MPASDQPIAGIARRQLHLFYLLDTSASMGEGGKIAALNDAMRAVLPQLLSEMQKPERAHAEMFLRIIDFSTGAHWHLETPTKIEDYQDWPPLEASGTTDLGEALTLLAEALENTLPRRALPPCVLLMSDGQPTDDYFSGIEKLKALPIYNKIVKIAISCGSDCDTTVLKEFTGNMELVLEASNRDQFINMIRWASTSITTSASEGIPQEDGSGPIVPPPPPELTGGESGTPDSPDDSSDSNDENQDMVW
jgi:uncharacterized protein YegL